MMVPPHTVSNTSSPHRRRLSVLLIVAMLGILIVANVHLVYVAYQSQPDCVPHAKTTGEGAPFRAARSAC